MPTTTRPPVAPAEQVRKTLPKSSTKVQIHQRPERHINAGDVFASRTPTLISTTLGSCVAACLFDPIARVGGMNHFMLPYHTMDSTASARYGINAMELLINEIMKRGGDRRRLLAKVFGGGNVLAFKGAVWDVGKQNIEFIREFLGTEKIPIAAERLGGKEAMRVLFMSDTGIAYLKMIKKLNHLCEREALYSRQAAEKIVHPSSDNVTLF